MAGYWPWFFFLFCMFLWTETKSRSINTQKKRDQYSHLDRTSLVNKGFIIWDKTPKNLSLILRDQEKSRGYRQSQCGIWYILAAHGASHIINIHILMLVVSFFSLFFFYSQGGVAVFTVYDNISELVPDTEQTGLDG